MQGFRSAEEQKMCRRNIYNQGMTISGWARKYMFSRNTVVNILYRDAGISDNLVGIGKQIMEQLKMDGLI
jgi:hypothetical protein